MLASAPLVAQGTIDLPAADIPLGVAFEEVYAVGRMNSPGPSPSRPNWRPPSKTTAVPSRSTVNRRSRCSVPMALSAGRYGSRPLRTAPVSVQGIAAVPGHIAVVPSPPVVVTVFDRVIRKVTVQTGPVERVMGRRRAVVCSSFHESLPDGLIKSAASAVPHPPSFILTKCSSTAFAFLTPADSAAATESQAADAPAP